MYHRQMTRKPCAQQKRANSALKSPSGGRRLAQRRADLQAQVRRYLGLDDLMGLLDLSKVRDRCHDLMDRLQAKEGKSKTQEWVAAQLGIPTRTLQTWINGEVEPDLERYEMLAEFFSKQLERKVSANWIMFGQNKEPPLATPDQKQLSRIEEKLDSALAVLKALAPDAFVQVVGSAAQSNSESNPRPAPKPASNARKVAAAKRPAVRR
jgi:transcriptional regulator with XRE-family HTH domain